MNIFPPCDPKAEEFAKCLLAMIDSDAKLKEAKANVPDYTGSSVPSDYYNTEQIDWNLCANNLYRCVNNNRINFI